MSDENMETEFNEHDIVVFEDYKVKIFKNDDNSSINTSTTNTNDNISYDIISTVLKALKEISLYIEVGFFHNLTFDDVDEYLSNIDVYEQFDMHQYRDYYNTDFLQIKHKNPTFEEWCIYNMNTLTYSYEYMSRICETYYIENNTFYRFCLLGYNTSLFT